MSDVQVVARTVWISDVHLGTPECQAERLLAFLRQVECEHLYLVGDIVDFMALRRSWFWPQAHNDVVQKLLRKARKGTRITFIPGNHDEDLRQFCGHTFGNISLEREVLHTTVDGRVFLVHHGDEFDGLLAYVDMVLWLAGWIYVMLFRINRACNGVRAWFGWGRTSMTGWMLRKINAVAGNDARARLLIAKDAKGRQVDGVVCGHSHVPEVLDIEGVRYMNCGDWVEHCTALVEWTDGRIELLSF